MAIDLNPVSEGTLAHEGTILLTGEDGSQSKFMILHKVPQEYLVCYELKITC